MVNVEYRLSREFEGTGLDYVGLFRKITGDGHYEIEAWNRGENKWMDDDGDRDAYDAFMGYTSSKVITEEEAKRVIEETVKRDKEWIAKNKE